MINDEIQSLLDGELADEQTAELLHVLSVSPEKREAFRQHMSLRGAIQRDKAASVIKESEDERVWAAVIGATGGATAGAISGGSSSWLGRAAAFAATAAASFLLGLATGSIDLDSNSRTTDAAPLDLANTVAMAEAFDAIGQHSALVSAPSAASGSTVALTDSPRSTSATRSGPTRETSPLAQTQSLSIEGTLSAESDSPLASSLNQESASDPTEPSVVPANAIGSIQENRKPAVDPAIWQMVSETTESPRNPDEMLVRAPTSSEPADLVAETNSLMRNGFEMAYSERFGRIAPAPVGVESSNPDFSSRAAEISYRGLEGRIGIGARAQYGTFSQVQLRESTWYDLGTVETIFEPTLERADRFTGELFMNYRLPLMSDLAATAEIAFGSSNAYTKLGGDIGLMLLITDWMGAHAAAGYSNYWYSIHDQRRELMDRFENTGVTDAGISDFYRGSMFEGRYGLFFRF